MLVQMAQLRAGPRSVRVVTSPVRRNMDPYEPPTFHLGATVIEGVDMDEEHKYTEESNDPLIFMDDARHTIWQSHSRPSSPQRDNRQEQSQEWNAREQNPFNPSWQYDPVRGVHEYKSARERLPIGAPIREIFLARAMFFH